MSIIKGEKRTRLKPKLERNPPNKMGAIKKVWKQQQIIHARITRNHKEGKQLKQKESEFTETKKTKVNPSNLVKKSRTSLKRHKP